MVDQVLGVWAGRGGGDCEVGLSALAHHYSQAASAATAAKAVEYGVRAAASVEARYAHDVAVALLTDAVASFDRTPREDRDPSERVDLLDRSRSAWSRASSARCWATTPGHRNSGCEEHRSQIVRLYARCRSAAARGR
ncbi:hypothetical protein [Streptosporangium canum]|uniref:hypothetical protein n=1 Tax=Streptosporangium canum TaxID=324952 RepID=UPI00378869CD